jgi:hypothetical protein
LLQTGTQDQCINGVQRDVAWFEEYPSNPNEEAQFRNLPVASGDVIIATVFQGASGVWETKVDDLTRGLFGIMVTGLGWGVGPDTGTTFTQQGSTLGLSYGGGYTAEWIVEDYDELGAPVPFANYGTLAFSNLQTGLSSWSLTPAEAVAITQNGSTISTPSRPSNGGFSVSYTGT